MPKLPLQELERLRKKFPKKFTVERSNTAETLRGARNKDRSFLSRFSPTYRTSGGLLYYKGLFYKALGMGIQEFINKKLAQKTKVRILDVGAGRGRALYKLKKLFGDKIITSSISLTRPKLANKKIKGTDLKAIDEVHIGRIENSKNLGTYDLIVSASGILWSTDVVRAVKTVYNSLAPQGSAVFNVDFLQLKTLRRYLQRNRISYNERSKIGVGVIHIRK